jgi:phosphate starvation-inducible PhoH-like protein
MYRLYSRDKIDKEVTEGNIEVIPVGFLRGRNFTNCVVVIDEAQNITHSQMQLLLGRMCSGSKLILCGDVAQIDLKDKKSSGFDFICKHFIDIEGFKVINLKTNHRDVIVESILKIYKDYDN